MVRCRHASLAGGTAEDVHGEGARQKLPPRAVSAGRPRSVGLGARRGRLDRGRLRRDAGSDPKRIYADGLSNGGGMAFLLSCTMSDRIAAVGLVASAQFLSAASSTRAVRRARTCCSTRSTAAATPGLGASRCRSGSRGAHQHQRGRLAPGVGVLPGAFSREVASFVRILPEEPGTGDSTRNSGNIL
jgi:hypothetical protein